MKRTGGEPARSIRDTLHGWQRIAETRMLDRFDFHKSQTLDLVREHAFLLTQDLVEIVLEYTCVSARRLVDAWSFQGPSCHYDNWVTSLCFDHEGCLYVSEHAVVDGPCAFITVFNTSGQVKSRWDKRGYDTVACDDSFPNSPLFAGGAANFRIAALNRVTGEEIYGWEEDDSTVQCLMVDGRTDRLYAVRNSILPVPSAAASLIRAYSLATGRRILEWHPPGRITSACVDTVRNRMYCLCHSVGRLPVVAEEPSSHILCFDMDVYSRNYGKLLTSWGVQLPDPACAHLCCDQQFVYLLGNAGKLSTYHWDGRLYKVHSQPLLRYCALAVRHQVAYLAPYRNGLQKSSNKGATRGGWPAIHLFT